MFLPRNTDISEFITNLINHVQNSTARIMAVLLIMRRDDGVEWDSEYGYRLVKFEADLSAIYIRQSKVQTYPSTAQLYVDFVNCCHKHKQTLHEIECYYQDMSV